MGDSLAFSSRLKKNTLALLRKLHVFKPEPTQEQKISRIFLSVLEKTKKCDFDGTIKRLNQILEINPKNVQAHAFKGLIGLELWLYAMAETEFNTAVLNSLAIQKEEIEYGAIDEYMRMRCAIPLPHISTIAHQKVNEAMIWLKLGLPEAARKEFKTAMAFARNGK
jgi:hypothetical protein